MSKHTIGELYQMQSLSLNSKINMTRERIKAWYEEYNGQIYVSFSGGKDSTVLADLVRNECGYKDVPLVFVDTGLEYPEIREFVKTFDNVEWLKPKKNFKQVIEEYGYPFISKEVSECVYGARKYLTSIADELSNVTDRQTDRQTDRTDTSMTRYADRVSMLKMSRGGADNKYRKLRGIGEYSKSQNGQQGRGKQSEISNNVRVVDERKGESDKGEYP